MVARSESHVARSLEVPILATLPATTTIEVHEGGRGFNPCAASGGTGLRTS
jgi:hypothetical protein